MFDHEKLQVYGKALDFGAKAAAWTNTWDHHRFLQIAQSAAVKGAVFLDLGVERAFLVETETTAGQEILRRISAMVAGP